MTIISGYDYTSSNYPQAPGSGQVAGYTTGTPDIQWTQAMWDAHPDAVRICQDAGATDTTADVLDIETGAATNAEAAAWYGSALVNFHAGTRPGQRLPALYCSASNVTPLVNQLIADGVSSGPLLWVAHWGIGLATATAMLNSSGGPFPIVAVQYQNEPLWDDDVFLSSWLTNVSVAPSPPPAPVLVSVEVTASYSDGSVKTFTA